MTKEKNLKAVPAGEMSVMKEFKPKVQVIELMQYEYDDLEDKAELLPKFTYEDVKGYSLNGPYIVIVTPDDTQYVHRAELFALIKISVKE